MEAKAPCELRDAGLALAVAEGQQERSGTVHATGESIRSGLRRLLDAKGLAYHLTGHASMFGIMFTEHVATEYRDWAKSDHELYDAVALGMLARGAMPEPDSREPWFMCEAHAADDSVDVTVSAFEASLREALDARARGDIESVKTAAMGAQSHSAAG